jgi:GNAT superfamily N-acetyltransferase
MWLLGFTPGGASPIERAGDVLDALAARTRALGPAARLTTGGPPACYLASGVSGDDDATLALLHARGFVETARHVDLAVALRAPAAPDARVRRCPPEEREELFAWVTRAFALAWGRECRRGLRHGGAFVAGPAGGYVGFCSHSGHNAALGTFGPLGVSPDARRGGLGAALARAALDDLYARGFRDVTIPWVAPELVAFYGRLCSSVRAAERRVLTLTLD